jgi:hypothetical protein
MPDFHFGPYRLSGAARSLVALALAAFVVAWPTAGLPASGQQFRPFLGTWSGRGVITSRNGQRDPIACRATYETGDEQSMSQSLVCASDAFRLDIESSVTTSGRALQGQWQETTRNVQGQLSGELAHGDYEGMVTGPGFTARISLRASGRRQAVHIAPSAGDIQSVDIVLTRRK